MFRCNGSKHVFFVIVREREDVGKCSLQVCVFCYSCRLWHGRLAGVSPVDHFHGRDARAT